MPIQPLWGVEHDAWKGGTEGELGDAGSSYGCMGTPLHLHPTYRSVGAAWMT